jgi:hypothetical protein
MVSAALIAVRLVILVLGAHWIGDGAAAFAVALGVGQLLVSSLICHVGRTKRKVSTREPRAARPVWTACICGSGTRWSQGKSRQAQM